MMMHGVHALLDQEYSGDINIVPKFRFKTCSIHHTTNEQELRQLVKEGERATYSRIEPIRRCTHLQNLEDLHREYIYDRRRHLPSSQSSRRRPPPTAAQKKALKSEMASRSAKASAQVPPVGQLGQPPRQETQIA